MKIKLKDIIDLDYFISIDDALDSQEDIKTRTIKDRKIYNQCRNKVLTEKGLLLEWLILRKKEFFKKNHKKTILLPGTVFSILYSWMCYIMAFSGCTFGLSLAYSFLAYHGNRPINVSIFIVLFVVLPVLLLVFSLVLIARKVLGGKKTGNLFSNSIIHTLISSLFFNVLPKILQKTRQAIFKKSFETLEYTLSLIRIKSREYKDLFFWPVFIPASVFAFSFSAGALGGTFFRVIVSDMAFGWQSTLMASNAGVYDLVSFIALPWSWFVPKALAHPSLEQIEGSRIILKDGLSVLATHDLISWWPFICMGILFYAVIPRGVLIITGILAQKHVLHHFDFKRPRFKQLLIRMQSPVMDIDADKTRVGKAGYDKPDKDMKEKSSLGNRPDVSGQNVLLLASKSVYSDDTIQKIIKGIETHLFFNVKEILGINLDFDDDAETIQQINQKDVDHVILVHEVWQPPIRGLVHYITQVKAAMPEDRPLWILLTRDAGQADLLVDNTDINYDVWKKAIFKLENPYIVVKRFI